MKEVFHHVKVKIAELTKGVCVSLSDFWCLAENLFVWATPMYELATLAPTLNRFCDASGICMAELCSQATYMLPIT